MAITIPSDVGFMYRPIAQLAPVSRGERTSQILAPGEILEATAPTTGQLKVITSASPGAPETTVTLNNGASQSFGPSNEQITAVVINQPFSAGNASLAIARRN